MVLKTCIYCRTSQHSSDTLPQWSSGIIITCALLLYKLISRENIVFCGCWALSSIFCLPSTCAIMMSKLSGQFNHFYSDRLTLNVGNIVNGWTWKYGMRHTGQTSQCTLHRLQCVIDEIRIWHLYSCVCCWKAEFWMSDRLMILYLDFT